MTIEQQSLGLHAKVVAKPPCSITLELSQSEQTVVMAMRDNIDREVLGLRGSLKKVDQLLYESTSKSRYPNARIQDPIDVLIEHNIVVPPAPGTQYPGTPSPYGSN
jgi:hypothetical protein